jgi:excisionase family DNA binding protein
MNDHDVRTQISIRQLLDAPTVVDLTTAARALGIGRTLAYQLVRDNQFPVPVLRTGRHYRVPTATLLSTLGLSRQPADNKPDHPPASMPGTTIDNNHRSRFRRFSLLRREREQHTHLPSAGNEQRDEPQLP